MALTDQSFLFSDPSDVTAVADLAAQVGAPAGPVSFANGQPVYGKTSAINPWLIMGAAFVGVLVLAMPSGRRR